MQPNACTTREIKKEIMKPSDSREGNDHLPDVHSIMLSALQIGGLSGMTFGLAIQL